MVQLDKQNNYMWLTFETFQNINEKVILCLPEERTSKLFFMSNIQHIHGNSREKSTAAHNCTGCFRKDTS